MDNRPIGLFDSGVGGLSVLEKLLETIPNEEFIYLADTKNFPYGNKSKESIIELSRTNINYLLSKNVKMIIIACGTATSQALDIVKKEYNIPIIGIIDPTIDYLEKSHKDNETIGIIATNGTINSRIWEEKIKSRIPNTNIISVRTPLLAPLAEAGWINNIVAEYTIKEYMKNLKNISKLILGCTHYIIFEELIKKEIDNNIEIINTGITASKYVKKYLEDNNMNNNLSKNKFTIYLTDKNDNFKNIAKLFLNKNIDEMNITIVE